MMDLNMLIQIVLGLCCIIDSTAAGCVDGFHGDPDYEKCKTSVAKLNDLPGGQKVLCRQDGQHTSLGDVTIETGWTQDHHDARTIPGKPPGKRRHTIDEDRLQAQEAYGCWVTYSKVCPEVLNSPGLLNGEPMSSMMKNAFHDLPYTITRMSPRSDGRCLALSDITPYATLPAYLELVCNSFWSKIKCLDGSKDQCSQSVRRLGEYMFGNNSKVAFRPGPDAPIDPEVLAFMREECPNILPQFSKNVCFNQKLTSKKYLNCYEPVDEEHGYPDTCAAFKAARKCIEDSMLVCGGSKLRAFLRGAHVLMFGGQRECEAEITYEDDTTGGIIRVSIVTLCIPVTLSVLNFH